MIDTTRQSLTVRESISESLSKEFEIIGATESEGKGFSNGLWREESKVAQATVNGVKKFKRVFIKRLF